MLSNQSCKVGGNDQRNISREVVTYLDDGGGEIYLIKSSSGEFSDGIAWVR